MVSKLRMIILVALTLMAVTSPLLQVDSLDSFPVCSDDLELLVMFCLCLLGMVLVFTHLFKLVPLFMRAVISSVRSVPLATLLMAEECGSKTVFAITPVPLRI